MAKNHEQIMTSRYARIYEQLVDLVKKTEDPISKMATICAVLHHKNPQYFWTGFYLLKNDKLVVGPYQGPLACLVLEPPNGVCHAAAKKKESVLVFDVEQFAGHVACDSRSKSEVVIPLKNKVGETVGVLDVDSDKLNAFNEVDVKWLEKITALVF